MPVIKALLNFFKRADSGLYDFEKSAIEQVIGRVGGAGAQLRRQVGAINTVQRIAGGKEVNLYCLRGGKPAFDEQIRFAGIEEALLATVHLQESVGDRRKLKLELWLANGRLFTLMYDKAPQDFFGGSKRLPIVRPVIAHIKIGFDPLRPMALQGRA